MGLARENDLHWLEAIGEQMPDALNVIENEIGALVACETPCETERENLGIKQSAERDHALRAYTFFGPFYASAFVDLIDQQALEAHTHSPELLIRYLIHPLPELWIFLLGDPIRTQVLFEPRLEPDGIHPGGHVNAIGDGTDGYFLFSRIGPESGPHFTRHFTVLLADGVRMGGHAKSEDSHIESRVGIRGIGSELKQTLAARAELLVVAADIFVEQREGKNISAGGEWSVRGEDRCAANFGDRILELRTCFDQQACP